MKSTDYHKNYGDGTEIQPGSRLLYVVSEKMEGYNGLKVSLRFERHSSTHVFPELRDCVIFNEGDSAQEVISYLQGLVDRLQKMCVNKLRRKPNE
jgi:hypothetical protein